MSACEAPPVFRIVRKKIRDPLFIRATQRDAYFGCTFLFLGKPASALPCLQRHRFGQELRGFENERSR